MKGQRKYWPLFTVFALLACLLTSFNAFAKQSELPNGKPFQMLNEAVEELSAEVEAAVGGINAAIAGLQSAVSDINMDIDGLDARITNNTNEIQALLEDTAALSAQVEANREGLLKLASRHDADIAAINAEIAALNAQIAALQAQLSQAVDDINAQLAVLNSAVEGNSGDISSLLADVTTLLGQVASINLTISVNQSRIQSLEEGQLALASLITALTAELDNRVTTLEGYHIDSITPGNTDFFVSTEGLNGTGVVDFRCAEWSGDVCTRPQTRVPSTTCGTYSEADVWHDLVYFNIPQQRICPSFCSGATGDGSIVSCSAGSGNAPLTPAGRVTQGWNTSVAQTGCLNSADYRWIAPGIAHPSSTSVYSTRFSTMYAGQAQLNIQCNWVNP